MSFSKLDVCANMTRAYPALIKVAQQEGLAGLYKGEYFNLTQLTNQDSPQRF